MPAARAKIRPARLLAPQHQTRFMCWWNQIVARGRMRRIRLRAIRVSPSENGRRPG